MTRLGRPTKYDHQMLAKAQSYVQHCQKAKEMPFIEELALTLDVNDDTIVEWGKEHDEFSATVRKLKMLQKLHLKKGALEKKLHASIAVFLLKTNHGMNEDEKEPELDHTTHIHFVGRTPTTMEDAMYDKNEAIADLEKAEKAIEKFCLFR
ncbi:MAG: terminase small subunit [Candidatus Peribacteraceae bacterium]|nr:terminase small subunit [Candidatus Peribacteraceae bacterium]